ncbi:MAG TPA: radical SAM protein, partial [Candidatus Omnitrophota bacterium]|nr:radical SAM protein [Candidatus Omnitrophota bacterium]
RHDIYEIIGYIKKCGMSCHLCTNGTLLEDHAVERLKASGVGSVSVSLDSVRAGVHNRLRGFDCFDSVVRGIRRLRQNIPGVRIGINCMITKANIDGIEDMLPFAQSLGADQIKFDVIHTHLMHRRKHIGSFQGLLFGNSDMAELRGAVKRLEAAAVSSPLLTNSLTFIRGMGLMNVPGARRLPCYAGYHSCSINPYGFVSACSNQDGTQSVRDSSLEDIWRSAAFREQRLYAMRCRERCWNSTYGELNIRCSLRHAAGEWRQVMREFDYYRSGVTKG